MSWIITGTQKNNWTPVDIDTALWLGCCGFEHDY